MALRGEYASARAQRNEAANRRQPCPDAGEVLEAIVFVDEPAPAEARMLDREDIFAEMRPYMVNVEDLDDTREAVYTRGEGE